MQHATFRHGIGASGDVEHPNVANLGSLAQGQQPFPVGSRFVQDHFKHPPLRLERHHQRQRVGPAADGALHLSHHLHQLRFGIAKVLEGLRIDRDGARLGRRFAEPGAVQRWNPHHKIGNVAISQIPRQKGKPHRVDRVPDFEFRSPRRNAPEGITA